MIEQLTPLAIEDVGGPKWHAQHEWIEKLNLQAHFNAQSHSDEFVVELMVSHDKMQVLVHDLLLIEAWKQLVYPHLADHMAERVDGVTSYVVMFHEATVANLLEVMLYHSHAAEAVPEEYLLELADWAYRKLTLLNSQGAALAEHKEYSVQELMAQSRRQELDDKKREVEFGVAMTSLTVLRYLSDHLSKLPMGALSRMVSTNDTIMGLLPLLERPPWVRTRMVGGATPAAAGGAASKPSRVMEKWNGQRWAAVPPAERLKMCQADGQVWLALTNLLVEPRARSKYSLDEWRREKLQGLKRHLNELIFDQLPVLKDLQRVLDEMALGALPDQQAGGSKAGLILEAVPVVRDAMLRGRDWRAVAEAAKKGHFGEGAQRMAKERLEAMVKAYDFMAQMEPELPAAAAPADAAAAGSSGRAGPEPLPHVKVSTWRKVHNSGVYEPWYDFPLEIDEAKPPEPVEVAVAGAPGAKGAAAVVHGLRYRLKPLDVEGTRPLPAVGKAVVRHGEAQAEALLQLPELPLRDSEEGAPVLWVTVGLLAVDGLALQIKLKKAPKPKERDRVSGVWYAYHPVAGALTLLRQQPGGAAPAAPPVVPSTSTSSGKQQGDGPAPKAAAPKAHAPAASAGPASAAAAAASSGASASSPAPPAVAAKAGAAATPAASSSAPAASPAPPAAASSSPALSAAPAPAKAPAPAPAAGDACGASTAPSDGGNSLLDDPE